jgi:hypothetical protein
MSTERKVFERKMLYNYGNLEQVPLNIFQRLIILREKASIRKNFTGRVGSTAILYGYPEYHGNVQSEYTKPRENMPSYLDSVKRVDEGLDISTLVLSGFVTEHKYPNGNYINRNPISEAQAAKGYYESTPESNDAIEIGVYDNESNLEATYISSDFVEVVVHNLESEDGESKFVTQLHNSLIELRRSGETDIVIHTRIQDTLRVRLVIRELYKLGKIPNDIRTKVISHSWKLDKGDATGSLAFSLIKFFKIDLPTIKQLPDYKE